MPHAIRMPKPGQMTEESVLSMWRKTEGERVAVGDIVFEIETDKSTMEVESFHDGVLLQQAVPAGETVPVNAVCAWIGEPGEAIPEPVDAIAGPADVPPAAAAIPGATPAEPPPSIAVPAAGRVAISPRARTRALAAGLEPRS